MDLDPNALSQVTKTLETDQVKALTQPALAEVGGLLGDAANLVRFYMTENMERVFTRWAAARHGAAIKPEEARRILPLLPLAAAASTDELHERWANLLASAASGSPDYLPSFGPTLSQLTVEEAVFLKRVSEAKSAGPGRRRFSKREILSIVHPDIHPNLVWDGRPREDWERLPPEMRSYAERAEQLGRNIEDLTRIGIIEKITTPPRVEYVTIERHKIPTLDSHDRPEVSYALSSYGSSFVRAVSGEESADASTP